MAVMRGVGLGVCYALAYSLLRDPSMDQWFLPAGLRVAALLLVPRRYWLALFVGEASAILYNKLHMLDQGTLIWAIVKPLIMWPPVAAIVHQIRKRSGLPRIRWFKDIAWFLSTAVACSATTTVTNTAANALLQGTNAGRFDFEQTLIYFLGDYLGILMIGALALLWLPIKFFYHRPDAYTIKSTVIAAMAYGLYAAIFVLRPPAIMDLFHALQFVIVLPVVWLTVRHGWRGAVIGSTLANLCVGLTLHQRGVGVVDQAPLLAQVALAIVATAFIGLGGKITQQNRVTQHAKRGEQEFRELAKAGFMFSESNLREKRQSITDKHAAPWKPRLVGRDFVVAESLVIETIYPMELDKFGLFMALQAPSFRADLAHASIAYRDNLQGGQHSLSEPIRQTLYRLAYDAVHHLAMAKPAEIRLSLKIIGTQIPKAVLLVRSLEPCETIALPSPRMASLKARARAFDAVVRVRDRSIAVVLSDVDAVAPAAMVGGRG